MKINTYRKILCAGAAVLAGCTSSAPAGRSMPSGSAETAIEDESVPSGNSELDAVKVTFTARKLEFDLNDADPMQYVYCDHKDVKIETKDTIDLRQTGEQTVTYELRLGSDVRKESHTFVIRDTKPPVISIQQSEIELSVGQEYDVRTNVLSVMDPVEGELPYLERKPQQEGQGWYTIFGAYSTAGEGIYDLTVEAFDCNGNEAEEDIRIIVR
ncbi:MAG: hypothetical protein IKG46_00910 [Solobacterium sp.]|nr:hypothetical protein [Solobacterium sp.]